MSHPEDRMKPRGRYAPRPPIQFAVCVTCGTKFARTKTGTDALRFCDRDCFYLHFLVQHDPAETQQKRRMHHVRWARKAYKSPKKTVEEDLAWMYDEKSAFIEDTHRSGRRAGGAGPRHLRKKIL